NYYANDLGVLNTSTNTMASTTPSGIHPAAFAYDRGKGEIFVTNYGSSNVSVINATTSQTVANISVGSYPWSIAYDARQGELFVTNFNSANVSVINDSTNSVVANFSVGSPALGVVYDSGAGEAFVTNYDSNNVTVINASTLVRVATIPVGDYPWGLTYDNDSQQVFVANYASNNVSVINGTTNTVVSTVAVGSYPDALTYDSVQKEILIANYGSNSVSLVSGATNTFVGSVAVGITPSDLTYDSSGGDIYVSNFDGGTLSILSFVPAPSSAVTFTESGLPSGTSWSITLNGTTQSSATTMLNFTEAPGVYSYSVGPVAGYASTPVSGTVELFAEEVRVNVSFDAPNSPPPPTTYGVSLQEVGLPSDTTWSANLNGATSTSGANTILFSEPNGSYSLLVPSVGSFSANFSSPLVVDGASLVVGITFSNGSYPVNFSESGLPSGSLWTVTATDRADQATVSSRSTGPSITLWLSDGTYSLSASGPGGYRLTLSDASLTIHGAGEYGIAATFSAETPGAAAALFLPWLTTGVLVITLLVGLVGAGWGYRQYQLRRWRSEAQRWVEELNRDGSEIRVPPPR
ncbi:MAG: hypothetical protein L3K02_03305, partial [Thermoplasmata archaeon]|nr:hypothetical protein [Thermoplasmata archaeon]